MKRKKLTMTQLFDRPTNNARWAKALDEIGIVVVQAEKPYVDPISYKHYPQFRWYNYNTKQKGPHYRCFETALEDAYNNFILGPYAFEELTNAFSKFEEPKEPPQKSICELLKKHVE